MLAEAIFGGARSVARSWDPVHPRDPVLSKMWGAGRKSAAGVEVNEQKVLAIPAVLRGTSILTGQMMKMPRDVYLQTENGPKPDKTHFARPFVRRDFNDEMLASDAIETMTQWMVLRGNACAWINRDQAGRPTDIIPLLPDRMGIFRISKSGSQASVEHAGKLMYWTQAGGKFHKILPENVIHIRGFSTNGLWGLDIIELMKETFGGDLATREHGHRFFGQGGTHAGFVTIPKGLPPEAEERLIKSLQKTTGGLGTSHKYVILEEGQEVMNNTISNNDSQFLELKKFNVRDIANIIRIQAEKVGDRDHKSYNSLEMAGQEHKDDDVMPIKTKWRDEFSKKLLTTKQWKEETHVIDFDDSELEWVSFRDRVSAAKDLFLNGLGELDECRKKVGLDPKGGKVGKMGLRPMNHVPCGHDDAEAEKTTDGTKVIKTKSAKAGNQGNAKSSQLTAPEAVQKVYLGVNTVLTSDEARKLVNDETGAGLAIPGPEFSTKPEPTDEAEQVDSTEPTDNDENQEASLAVQLTAHEVGRIEKRLRAAAFKKAQSSESDFIDWVDSLNVEQGPAVLLPVTKPMVESLKSSLVSLLESAASGDDLTPKIETIFASVFTNEGSN